jgi:hypothetical protein
MTGPSASAAHATDAGPIRRGAAGCTESWAEPLLPAARNRPARGVPISSSWRQTCQTAYNRRRYDPSLHRAADATWPVCACGGLYGMFTVGAPGSLVGKPDPGVGSGPTSDGHTYAASSDTERRRAPSPRPLCAVADSAPPPSTAHLCAACCPYADTGVLSPPRSGTWLPPVAEHHRRAALRIRERRTSK